jgi:hypothetical protein
MDPNIVLLTQEDADRTMKSLGGVYFLNLCTVFHDERIRVTHREPLWALPEAERSYYRVQSYLFGVNKKWAPLVLILSAFARVLRTRPRDNCAGCLKMLLEQELCPRSPQQAYVQARLNEKGKGVFHTLRDLRSDLYRVDIQQWDGHYFPATITYL